MRVIKSFACAFDGLKDCFLHEKNFRIQYVIALLVIIAGLFFSLTATEWTIIFICFAVVLSFEIINSAIEKLCDLVCPDFNLTIKKVKDIPIKDLRNASRYSSDLCKPGYNSFFFG